MYNKVYKDVPHCIPLTMISGHSSAFNTSPGYVLIPPHHDNLFPV